MTYQVTVLPQGVVLDAPRGASLQEVLRGAGLVTDAPCGGMGTCGKCRVTADGREVLACRTAVEQDMIVVLPPKETVRILAEGAGDTFSSDMEYGYALAIDIGTTTVVCYLLDHRGRELASASALNPQSSYGADVITRIQAALHGALGQLTDTLRAGLLALTEEVCRKAQIAPEEILRITPVGNPCMQQFLFGIPPQNLVQIPFAPAIRAFAEVPVGEVFPCCPHAELHLIPDISGYVGADTIGCMVSAGLHRRGWPTLLVDIGTNGEMVLGDRTRIVACAAAAGPALEGANIRFGMRGSDGAIDRVWWEDGALRVHVIGGGRARGICGSGLIDAAALLLTQGAVNARGRIQTPESVPAFARYLGERGGERIVALTDTVHLTQSDIRQVQLAKGAIAAGIELMARQMGIARAEIQEVLLAGAFGSFIRPESACAIGLLPPELLPRIRAVGNAAGSGAKQIACSREQQRLTDRLCRRTEFLELAALDGFRRCFAANTGFPKEGFK